MNEGGRTAAERAQAAAQSLVRGCFEPDGPLARAFGGYEYREGQVEMASLVQRAFDEDLVALVEAGTGIGKSFAYLVPALLRAEGSGDEDRTVVATATKNLQTQLSEKDIPQLFNALGRSCKVAVLYGRSNYICLRRLEERLGDLKLFGSAGDSDVAKFKEFCATTDTGLFQDCKTPVPPLLKELCASDGDLCRAKICPFRAQCFYLKAKARAAQARIVVTNHHLLFTDAVYRLDEGLGFGENAILPAYRRLVIDEAHLIEQNATDLFTAKYSGAEVSRQLGTLLRSRAGEAEGLLDKLAPFCRAKELPERIRKEAAGLRAGLGGLDIGLGGLLAAHNSQSLLAAPAMSGEVEAALGPRAGRLLEGEARLAASLARFSQSLGDGADPAEAEDLAKLAGRFERAFATLRAFLDFGSWTDDAHFIRRRNIRGNPIFEICIAPVYVGGKLQSGLFSQLRTVVCASATLNLGDDFGFFRSRVGLKDLGREVLTLEAPSPFDYERNLMLLAPVDSPSFSAKDEEGFTGRAASIICDAVSSAQGGALVLFTSYAMMDKVYGLASGKLEKLGIASFVQGSASRRSLLERFRRDKDSVLFATSSFWQGIDVPGESLRLVVIVKLPFAAPEEPIHKARLEQLEKQGKSGFAWLQLPLATMRLKQGFGRLIRNRTDRGVVLIIDSRIVAKNYGPRMLASLPRCYRPETSVATLASKIENFLYC